MTFYKITNKNNGSMAVLPSSKHYIQYKKGEFVEAKIGGLLVFDDLYLAKMTLIPNKEQNFRIWQVDVEQQVTLPSYRLRLNDLSFDSEMNLFWENFDMKNHIKNGLNILPFWPLNTFAFKRVKLVNEIFLP